jgi:gag-polypeptide of LTR copia-type
MEPPRMGVLHSQLLRVAGMAIRRKPGDVALAWERRNKKYEPKTAPSCINLKRIFTLIKKGTKDDPDEWLTSLEDMREQLINTGSTMTEDELLEHVFANLPKDYEVVANPLEKRLGSSSDPVTIEEIRHDLNLKYQKMFGVKKMTPMKNVKLHCMQEAFGAGAMIVARLATKHVSTTTTTTTRKKYDHDWPVIPPQESYNHKIPFPQMTAEKIWRVCQRYTDTTTT